MPCGKIHVAKSFDRNTFFIILCTQISHDMKKILLFALASTVLFSCSEEEAKIVNPDTVIKGKITNADGNSAWLESFKGEKTNATVSATGEFEIKIQLKNPSCFDLVNGNARTNLCLAPGDTINVSFDAKDIDATVKYEGKNSKFSNYLADKTRKEKAMSTQLMNLFNFKQDSFLININNIEADFKKDFEAIKNDTSINKNLLAWAEDALNQEKNAFLYDYRYYHNALTKDSILNEVPQVMEVAKGFSANSAEKLHLAAYRSALNSFINYHAGTILLTDTALANSAEGKEKAVWMAIDKNISDAAVKEYLQFNFINKNASLAFVAEEKTKFKAATKDTVYQKLMK